MNLYITFSICINYIITNILRQKRKYKNYNEILIKEEENRSLKYNLKMIQ